MTMTKTVTTDADTWADIDDEWSEPIKEALPMHSGSHEDYAMALRMVGHRHSKRELVALVNWLLVQNRKCVVVVS